MSPEQTPLDPTPSAPTPRPGALAPHPPSLASLVFGVGFAMLGAIVLSDTSLDETGVWLWALALIVVGLASIVAVIDRVRREE